MVLVVGVPIKYSYMKRACRGYCMGVLKIYEIHGDEDEAHCSYHTTR